MKEALGLMQAEYQRLMQRTQGERAADSQETFAIIHRIAAELKAKRQAV